MGARAWIFAALLLASSGLIVAGVSAWSAPAGLIAGGVLLAVWAWLVLGERPDAPAADQWVPAVPADGDDG